MFKAEDLFFEKLLTHIIVIKCINPPSASRTQGGGGILKISLVQIQFNITTLVYNNTIVIMFNITNNKIFECQTILYSLSVNWSKMFLFRRDEAIQEETERSEDIKTVEMESTLRRGSRGRYDIFYISFLKDQLGKISDKMHSLEMSL